MDKEIYKQLKEEEVISELADDIIEAFRTKMNQDTIDYSFDIAKGTGKIKTIEPNTFFNFDTKEGSALDKFKKSLFAEDLGNLTQNEEAMLIEDVSEFLKEVAVMMIGKYEQDMRDTLRKNIMPGSSPKDFPFERMFIASIDIADWSSIPEPQKHLLRISKNPGAFINTDVVINYVQNRQEETGMSVADIFAKEKEERNPLFEDIVDIEQGDRYLYEINVAMFVDYSLAEKSMEELAKIEQANRDALQKAAIEQHEKLEDDTVILREDERSKEILKELE